jgi:hypothetical protein
MNGNEPDPQELPQAKFTEVPQENFTKVPNVFLEDWVNILGLVEIRIMAAILRGAFGWHKTETKPLSVSQLSEVTKRDRTSVMKALERLIGHGIVGRSRLSRREAFAYGLIMRSAFKPLKEAPPPAKQKSLPYDVRPLSSRGNSTTGEVVKPRPLSSRGNSTTQPPVLISIKESRSKDTHTPVASEAAPVENIAVSQRVCVSRFSEQERMQYAEAQERSLGGGWVTVSGDGRSDALIQRYFDRLAEEEKRHAEWEAARAKRQQEERAEVERYLEEEERKRSHGT